MAAQIFLLTMWTMCFGYVIGQHGKLKDFEFHHCNMWLTLVNYCFYGLILWWGGFWNVFF